MNLWRSLARIYPRHWRRSPSAAADLTNAYRALFTGHGGEREAQIVLADLANASGFYRVNGPEFSAEARAFADGERSVYGRIFRFLRMSDAEVRQLEEAARAEAIADAQEGQI